MNKYVAGIVLGTALAVFAGAAGAPDPGGDDRDHHDHNKDRGHHDRDRDRHDNDRAAYRFRANDRDHFVSHYRKDIRQWREHPDRRHHFRAGERLPNGVRLTVVPPAYYRSLPPPPPGYRFGYYDGYVVAYNPTTQIVADVLDLVNAAVNH